MSNRRATLHAAAIGFMLIVVAPLIAATFAYMILPWWETRGLGAAAEEVRTLPYVRHADVFHDADWGDHILIVELGSGATDEDASRLWCDVLQTVGGQIEVYDPDRYLVFAPTDCPAIGSTRPARNEWVGA